MDQFRQAYWSAFQRFSDFDGRTSVGGFWRFVAVNFAIALVLGLIGAWTWIVFIFYVVYLIAVIIPSLAVAVRRLHDTGRSGWMLLLGLIPLVGAIILIVFYVQPSESTENRWGPPPAPGR